MNALYCMQCNECKVTLVGSHMAYVIKTGSELKEGRDCQYRDKIEDSIDELKNIAMLVVVDRDAQGTPGSGEGGWYQADYELASIRMDAKIAELRLSDEEVMIEAQHKEHTHCSVQLRFQLNNMDYLDFG